MSEQPTTLHTVPTELERADAFYDGTLVVGFFIGAWYLNARFGVGLAWFALPFLIVSVWALTGEPAGDVPYVGALAAGLRSKLGLRRAHEWVQVYAHYWNLAIRPVWRAHWDTSYRSLRQRTTHWPTLPNAAIKWCRSRASFKASINRRSFSRKPGK